MANGNPNDDRAYDNTPTNLDDIERVLKSIGNLVNHRFDTEDANNCSLAAALDFMCDTQDELGQAIENLHCGCFPVGVWPATLECIEAFRDRRREIEYMTE